MATPNPQWVQEVTEVFGSEPDGKAIVAELVEAISNFFRSFVLMVECTGDSKTGHPAASTLFCHGGFGTARSIEQLARLSVPLKEHHWVDEKGRTIRCVVGLAGTVLWSDPLAPDDVSYPGWQCMLGFRSLQVVGACIAHLPRKPRSMLHADRSHSI
jgi:hypothetical protein